MLQVLVPPGDALGHLALGAGCCGMQGAADRNARVGKIHGRRGDWGREAAWRHFGELAVGRDGSEEGQRGAAAPSPCSGAFPLLGRSSSRRAAMGREFGEWRGWGERRPCPAASRWGCPGFGLGPSPLPGPGSAAGRLCWEGRVVLPSFFFFFPGGELILTEQTKKESSANETQMNLGWLRGC